MDEKNYNIIQGFNIIAPAYDLANDAMTGGMHRLWRRRLCKETASQLPRGAHVLDLATGTGDVAFELCELRPDITITAADPSTGMLDQAKIKHQKKSANTLKRISFEVADGRQLPYPDSKFDGVTISWGIRNIRPYETGLREIHRVLKPGAKVFILESGKPEWQSIKLFYKMYSKLLPLIGERISNFKPAYQYYTQSVESFPSGSEFVARLHELGFTKPEKQAIAGGIVYLYIAKKPDALENSQS